MTRRFVAASLALVIAVGLGGCANGPDSITRLRLRLEAVPGVSNVRLQDHLPENDIRQATKIELDMGRGDEASLQHLLSELRTGIVERNAFDGRSTTTIQLPGKQLIIRASQFLPESVPRDLARLTAPEGVTWVSVTTPGRADYSVTLAPVRLTDYCAMLTANPLNPGSELRLHGGSGSGPLTCP